MNKTHRHKPYNFTQRSPMAHINTNGVKPASSEFSYKNAFKHRIFTHLRLRPNLTFQEYRNKAKDMHCEQWAFDDVKKDIDLWGYWNGECIISRSSPEAKALIDKELQAQINKLTEAPPSMSPKRDEPIIMNVANQLALPEPKRRRLNPELKAIAIELLISKPKIDYKEFQSQLKWPECTYSAFYSMKAQLMVTGDIPKSDNHSTSGRGHLSGEVALARQNLIQLTYIEIYDMGMQAYKDKFGHRDITSTAYYNANKWALKQKAPTPEPKPVKAIVAAPAEPREAIEILAELDLVGIPPEHHMAVKNVFKSYFEKRAPNSKIKMVVQMDPPVLEIRKSIVIR